MKIYMFLLYKYGTMIFYCILKNGIARGAFDIERNQSAIYICYSICLLLIQKKCFNISKTCENVNISDMFSIFMFYHKPLGYCKFLSWSNFVC